MSVDRVSTTLASMYTHNTQHVAVERAEEIAVATFAAFTSLVVAIATISSA